MLQANDDPWVPAISAIQLQNTLKNRRLNLSKAPFEVVITAHGGHNGFHGLGETLKTGCWSDQLATAWFDRGCQLLT